MGFFVYLLVAIAIFKLYQVITCGTCKSRHKLTGKVTIVTGANSGIGFETAMELARRGAKVILACRNPKLGVEAQRKIVDSTGNEKVVYKYLDLSSLQSVRVFARDVVETEKRLDVLVNNAGANFLDQQRTADGLIAEYQINHFAPFLLTILLLPAIKAAAPSRIVNVSSVAHWLGCPDFSQANRKIWSDIRVYSNCKLYNIYFTRELSRRLKGTGVVVNCLHPGSARSNIVRNMSNFVQFCAYLYNNYLFKTEWEGAQTSVHLAVAPECENVTGQYFSDCRPQYLAPWAKNKRYEKELWDLSVKAVGLQESELKHVS